MTYSFKDLENRIEEIKGWLKDEFLSIQTGRATPAILDNIRIDNYGSKVPLNQVASISLEGPRTLKVNPWDKSQIADIEKAVTDADIGVSASSDDSGVRVSFPELTSEKRETLLKLVNAKHEEARVSLRRERDEIWQEIQENEKDGDISEDEKFRLKDEMEKLVTEANKELDEMTERKEKDIRG